MNSPNLPTRTQIAIRRFQDSLQETLAPAKDLSERDEIESVLPLEERQAAWRLLQADGFVLPGLQISARVFWLAAFLVVTPIALLVFAFKKSLAVFLIFEFSFLAYKLTRPLAVFPPNWCKTVGQAALCLRDIRTPDGRSVPWTREEIGMKVRMIIAECTAVPIEKLTDKAPLADMLC
jgi:hypothetical protein